MLKRGTFLALGLIMLPELLMAAVGPTRAELNGVRYRRHTPDGKQLIISLDAEHAFANARGLDFNNATLKRFDRDGRVAINLKAKSGQLKNSIVELEEQVVLLWRGNWAEIEFISDNLHWDINKQVLSSTAHVRGRIRPIGGRGFVPIEFQGRGLLLEGDEGRIEIGSGVVLRSVGKDTLPIRVSADDGFLITALKSDTPSLKMRGKVELISTGLIFRTDELDATFVRTGKAQRVAPLGLIARGSVSMAIDNRFKSFSIPFSPIEIVAEMLECDFAKKRVVLIGNKKTPSELSFKHGILGGNHIEITPRSLKTDGFSPSRFEYTDKARTTRTLELAGPVSLELSEKLISFKATRGVKLFENKKCVLQARDVFCTLDGKTQSPQVIHLRGGVKGSYKKSRFAAGEIKHEMPDNNAGLTTLLVGKGASVTLEHEGMSISSAGSVRWNHKTMHATFDDFVSMRGSGFSLRSGSAEVELIESENGLKFKRLHLKNGVRLKKDATKNTSARAIESNSALYTPLVNEVKFMGEPMAEYDNLEIKAPVLLLNLLTNLIETGGGKTTVRRKDGAE